MTQEKVHKLYSDDLEKALKVREDFLRGLTPERRRDALEFFRSIERKLKTVGNTHNRMIILQEMMKESCSTLNKKMDELGDHLDMYEEKITNLRKRVEEYLETK